MLRQGISLSNKGGKKSGVRCEDVGNRKRRKSSGRPGRNRSLLCQMCHAVPVWSETEDSYHLGEKGGGYRGC